MTSLVVLALLAIADGITTHIGLALGGVEVNPLFAPLLATFPLFGWGIYAFAWGGVIVWAWWARPRCGRRLWNCSIGASIGAKALIVAWNIGQLVLVCRTP